MPLNKSEQVKPIEEAKQSLLSFTMYYVKSLNDAGYSMPDAKRMASELLEKTYEQYCHSGAIEPKSLGSIEAKLTKAIEKARDLATNDPDARILFNDLISLQAQLKKGVK